MREKAPRPHGSVTSQRAAGSEELFRGASNPPDINNQDDEQVPIAVDEAQLIKKIKVYIEKGDKAKDKAEQYYTAAGLHLKELKEGKSKAEWAKLIEAKCGLGVRRAYELISIANGRKSVADIRLGHARRVQKHAQKRRALANAQNLPAVVGQKAEPEAEPTLVCSWCGQSQHERSALAVLICDECQDRVDIFRRGDAIPRKRNGHNLPAINGSVAPTATTAKSWKVEVIAKNGRRYGNGVRLRTEEEADAYRCGATLDLLRENAVIVTATEIIPCDDAPSGAMLGAKGGHLKGRFTGTVAFLHGTCGNFEWEEVPTEPCPRCGDVGQLSSGAACVSEVETIVRAAIRGLNLEERRELHEQLQDAIGGIMVDAAVVTDLDLQEEEPAHQQEAAPSAAGDDLDIPDYLRRAPKGAAAS
jgi:hypothetical protein